MMRKRVHMINEARDILSFGMISFVLFDAFEDEIPVDSKIPAPPTNDHKDDRPSADSILPKSLVRRQGQLLSNVHDGNHFMLFGSAKSGFRRPSLRSIVDGAGSLKAVCDAKANCSATCMMAITASCQTTARGAGRSQRANAARSAVRAGRPGQGLQPFCGTNRRRLANRNAPRSALGALQ